ncbi:MAG: asparagine synthase-related protein, partial [Planctomycetota bacterium]|nr:asparagine synthase-related protein [Planctomycetota bacterium]
MTAFAGVFSSRGPVPAAVRESLARHISRHPQEDVREDSHDRLHVVSFDAGLWRADGVHRDADGTFTIVAGDPVLHATGASRTDDVARLHAELRGKRNDALAGARGAFALVHYAPDRHELRLATDRGGIRPVYVCERDGLVFFATALRVLESIEALPLTVDLRGLANRLTFRTYLGTRTPYVGVTRLQAAETCRIDDSGTVYERFFDWTAIPESDAPLDVLAETAHSLFFDAVASRVRADSSAVSLLSGGLDSRFIVAELRRLEADVRTLNFSPVGTLDQVLSARFAEAAGTTHGEYPLPEGATAGDLSDWISSVRPRTGIEEDPCIARPGVVWHGFDGSFSIGYVHMPETQVRLLREDRVADAIAEDYRVRSL